MRYIFLFIIITPLLSNSQNLKLDLTRIIKKNTIVENSEYKKKHIPDQFSIDHVAEYKTIFLTSLKLYQTIISSQDNSVCNFTPSCSRFSSSVIRETGFSQGLLLTSDRLQRCNGSALLEPIYKFDPESQKFSDPINFYIK